MHLKAILGNCNTGKAEKAPSIRENLLRHAVLAGQRVSVASTSKLPQAVSHPSLHAKAPLCPVVSDPVQAKSLLDCRVWPPPPPSAAATGTPSEDNAVFYEQGRTAVSQVLRLRQGTCPGWQPVHHIHPRHGHAAPRKGCRDAFPAVEGRMPLQAGHSRQRVLRDGKKLGLHLAAIGIRHKRRKAVASIVGRSPEDARLLV